MDWSDERWVKLFTRDTTDWLALSWQAQGLFVLILRKVNRAGVIDLGRAGKRGLSSHIGGGSAWREMEPVLEELLLDGCVTVEGSELKVPNFVTAQTALQSDKARKRAERERAHDFGAKGDETEGTADDVTQRDSGSQNVTGSRVGVTRGHAASRDVTTRETRGEERDQTQSTPNGVLPTQRPDGAPAPAADPRADKGKRSPPKADDAPPAPDTPAARAVAALAAASVLRGLVKRPNALCAAMVDACPAVDVAAEIVGANGWCIAKPAKAPRSDGNGFLWSWVRREQAKIANFAAGRDQRADLFAPRVPPTVKVTRDTIAAERQRLMESTERKGA